MNIEHPSTSKNTGKFTNRAIYAQKAISTATKIVTELTAMTKALWLLWKAVHPFLNFAD